MNGFKKALAVFRKASREVPAYKKLLAKAKIIAADVKSINDFEKLPIINKENYLKKNSLPQLFPEQKIPPVAYASSGSSGQPTFWFRDERLEQKGAKIHKIIFQKIFEIKKEEPTLVVICFSMGIWIAGNYTLDVCRRIARSGYSLTLITPGIEKQDILSILSRLAHQFKNIILAGYPPFLMDVLIEVKKKKVAINSRIRLLTAGDKFSEQWRTDVMTLIQTKKPGYIVSVYGCADAGVLGYETPLSIFLRRESAKNASLYKTLFGNEADIPSLVQYDPKDLFFEEKNGELIFTVDTAIPLIRYNIHDFGRIINFEEAMEILKDHGLDGKAKKIIRNWKLPFLVKKGRADVAVTFYALNIYPENIKAGLENKTTVKYVTGNFFAYNKTVSKNRKQKFYLNVELAQGVKTHKKIMALVQKQVVKALLTMNLEYRKLLSTIGNKALPVIKLVPCGSQQIRAKGVRVVFYQKDKKAQVLN